MSDWPTLPLADVLDFKEGPGILARDFRSHGIPLIRLAGVKSGAKILDGCNFLDPDMVAKKWSQFRLALGDVLLSTSASLGEVAVVGPDGVGAIPYTGIIRFRPVDDCMSARFIPIALTSGLFKRQIEAMGAGSVLRHFGPMHLRQMTLQVPPIETQEAIADVIGALDDKIESNRRAIGYMEELGAALLESNLGLDVYGFPEYDETRHLGDMLEVIETGSRPKGGVTASDHGVVSLGAENVQSAGISTAAQFKRVPPEFAAAMKRGHLRDEDILVYKDGGKPGNFEPHVSAFGYRFPVDEATINEHVYRVRASCGIAQGLLYWLLRSPWMDQEMRKRGTGVAIPGLNSTNFRNLPLPVLGETTVDQLNRQLSPMFAAMLRYGTENARLTSVRDTLLPLLLAARLHVAEAGEGLKEFAV
jgi:type I restriction enzyme, S subunit